MRQIRFDPWVKIHKVDWPRARVRKHSEKGPGGKKRIEASHCLRARVVTAGNIGLQAEPRLEWNGGDAVSGVRSKRPGFDMRARECSELLDAFEVEVPGGL